MYSSSYRSYRKTPQLIRHSLGAILLTSPADAFEGGGWDDEKQSTTLDVEALQSLLDYRSYSSHCLKRELTIWGEVAELMTTIPTAICTCEYIELEQAKTSMSKTEKLQLFIAAVKPPEPTNRR